MKVQDLHDLAEDVTFMFWVQKDHIKCKWVICDQSYEMSSSC